MLDRWRWEDEFEKYGESVREPNFYCPKDKRLGTESGFLSYGKNRFQAVFKIMSSAITSEIPIEIVFMLTAMTNWCAGRTLSIKVMQPISIGPNGLGDQLKNKLACV